MIKVKTCMMFLCVLIVSLFFTSCGDDKIIHTDTNPPDYETVATKDFAIPIIENWKSSNGIYFMQERLIENPNGAWPVNTYDQNGNRVVKRYDFKGVNVRLLDPSFHNIILCNKPECNHMNTSCNAFIPARGKYLYPLSSFWGIGNQIFYIDNNYTIISMDENGMNHSEVMQIDKKYEIFSSNIYLYKNKIYIDVSFWPNASESMEHEVKLRRGMLELDLSAKSCKELYSFEFANDDSSLNILGISGGSVFYWYRSALPAEQARTQQAYDDANNNLDSIIYSMDLSTGKKTEIMKGKTASIDSVIMHGPTIYYHSREDGEIQSYQSKTKEASVVADQLFGYVDLDKFYNFYDNNLFYTKRHDLTDAYANPPKTPENFYVNLESKKSKKINYTVKNPSGESQPAGEIILETGDYFLIQIDNFDVNRKSAYGKILKQDYWNGNYSKTTPVDWK